MKVPKKSNGVQRNKKGGTHKAKRNKNDQVTEMLKVCLQKVCELQQNLERTEDFENDPQAAGYAACAMETIRFLAAEGLPPDHPVVRTLSEKLSSDRE
ncbi:hypothetical protein MML48_8g00013717 [Holotrichia oblita]|uniref:Uncharacterized protein n=2 Tax=Holotrichia oblita TaxID=644536 RepID=A0ACB9SUJ7_HOLOL|nr:hypothetical protein MML48_8g00016270 [Holotrichia oblita]KAI4456114.1 hypothetical protein MML48_8g00013717 [Holotrichia oblita]